MSVAFCRQTSHSLNVLKKLKLKYNILLFLNFKKMCTQGGDSIIIDDNKFNMSGSPLNSSGLSNLFRGTSTCNSRGYYATWRIYNKELYLIELTGQFAQEPKRSGTKPIRLSDYAGPYCNAMAKLFPNQTMVSADWFTGEIIVPNPRLLHSINSFDSKSEEDTVYEFIKGFLVNRKVVKNDLSGYELDKWINLYDDGEI